MENYACILYIKYIYIYIHFIYDQKKKKVFQLNFKLILIDFNYCNKVFERGMGKYKNFLYINL